MENLIFLKYGQIILLDGNYYTLTTTKSITHYFKIPNGAKIILKNYNFAGVWRPLYIENGGTAIISNCYFYNIKSYGTDASAHGGVIYAEGTSTNYAVLTISNCRFNGNTAQVIW